MTMLEEDLVGLTAAIWESVLGMGAVPVPPRLAESMAGPMVTACVNIGGDWDGSVALTFPTALCRRLASGMFGLDEAELDDELVQDAVGELANIAGGNVKGMVPGETVLSLPQVISGNGLTITVPGTRLLCAAAFDCEGDLFTVAVHGRDEIPGSGGM